MAIKKEQKNRVNASGTFDVIHYETDASQVLMNDGTTAEDKIATKADLVNGVVPISQLPNEIEKHLANSDIHVTSEEKAAWNAKQDAITGTQGQVVGFGVDGKPVAQDAPSSIPAGGTPGQVLAKKSETDYDTEWKDASADGIPINVEILETICENIELTDDNPSYTFPAAITLDENGLYYLYYKYYDADGNLDPDYSGGYFSKPQSEDSEVTVAWLSSAVTLTSTGVADTHRASGAKAVFTIVKVSTEVVDDLKFDAMNRGRSSGVASGVRSHAEGCLTTASGMDSHAEGDSTIASGACTHAEGTETTASKSNAHAEGFCTTASGNAASHAEGYYTTASGAWGSHAEGHTTTASGMDSHAEGVMTEASGTSAHAEGASTTASGKNAHAEGGYTTASGEGAHAEGQYSEASNFASHAGGKCTKAMADGGAEGNTVGDVMVLGNGTSTSARSNAFRVTYAGAVYGLSAFNSTGADYSEFFEWADLNPNAEDRVGYFVTIEGKQIRIANPGDYILGIVSGQPCIIGNADEDWQGRWLHDEFGRFIKEATEDPVVERREVEVPVLDEDGNPTGETRMEIQEVETGEVIHGWRYKANPDYDNTQQYIERKDRPEWDCVGMLGVLSVRDDGTCKVNGYCQVADGGIATVAENYVPGATYRVIERVTENVIRVVFR